MVSGGHLFYAAAEALPDVVAPEEPHEEIDWSFFEPRSIHRAPPGDARFGFPTGAPVLVAEEAWEGGEVRDPWAVALADGTSLLYYVAEGGIGLAEARSVDGAYARMGGGPVVAPGPGEVLARPSVALFRGTFFLYFETGSGEIALAESQDGRSFTRVLDAVPVRRGPVDGLPDEIGVGAPGALVVTTPAGRSFIRLYLESHREDGTHLVSLAATADGRTFERLDRPVVEAERTGEPGPLVVNDRVTVLYWTAPFTSRDGLQIRAIVAGVAPRTATF
jgi:hypothetical protein